MSTIRWGRENIGCSSSQHLSELVALLSFNLLTLFVVAQSDFGHCAGIERFLGDAFGVLSCQFWSIVLQSGARLPIHTLN